MRMWIPSPPQRVIGPVAYCPLEGGGVMKEPPPSLIVAGLANFGVGKSSQEENVSSEESYVEEFLDWVRSLMRTFKPHIKRNVICLAHNLKGYDSYFILEHCYRQYMGLWLESC